MYRNIVYNNTKSVVSLFTWDENGKRILKNYKYKPYLFTETSNESDLYSIFGNKLKKHTFKNQFERHHFVKNSGVTRIYNNLPIEQNFLIDRFWKECKKEEFAQFDLSIFALDIEVYSPDEFPDQNEAKHPINVMTIYNSLEKEYRVFCLENDFDPEKLSENNKERYSKITDEFDVVVTTHQTEKELLKSVLEYWKKDYPDIVTGWNLMFDILYIVNRMGKILPSGDFRKLSPVNDVKDTIKMVFGKPERNYSISGVTILDYMDLYKKFNFSPVPNMRLDTIAEKELNVGKVEYESDNLAQLADEDWDLFVFYNIEDVNVIRLLEDKLGFIKVGRIISYMGLCPFNKCMDTLPIVNGYCAVNAFEENKAIPTFNKDDVVWRKYEGAYVKEPIYNHCENIVSYDLNSLYPMTMITLNTSPETKFGKVLNTRNGKVEFEDNSGKVSNIDEEKFYKFLDKKNISMSKTGVLFNQNKQGIFPKLAEEVYNKRLEYKAKIKENKKKIEKSESSEEINELEYKNDSYDVFQMSFKILINSLYGYSGNKYAFMSDIDIAESITITCQNVIKESSNILNRNMAKLLKTDEVKDFVTYVDTDSVAGDSMIQTKNGSMSIETLFDVCSDKYQSKLNMFGKDIVKCEDEHCMYYDDQPKWGKIKNIIRHKVNKKKYRIKYGDNEVFMTEDHSLMVYRDDILQEIKPSEYKRGDKIVVL